jgi:YfiH family protein
MNPAFMVPDWPAPAGVRALMTLRTGGVSTPPWDSFNLATHCGDDPASVAANRARLAQSVPASPRWLDQVHGTVVVRADSVDLVRPPAADASHTDQPDVVCAVMVADCLPVLFCDREGTQVAAAHAGWRGLAAGVLEATIESMGLAPDQVMAWLGPAIGPQAFQVGPEVRDAFIATDSRDAGAFRQDAGDRWLCDLAGLARSRLERAGLRSIHGGRWCTVADPGRFYSYRRDRQCGRMAALVWRSAGEAA